VSEGVIILEIFSYIMARTS